MKTNIAQSSTSSLIVNDTFVSPPNELPLISIQINGTNLTQRMTVFTSRCILFCLHEHMNDEGEIHRKLKKYKTEWLRYLNYITRNSGPSLIDECAAKNHNHSGTIYSELRLYSLNRTAYYLLLLYVCAFPVMHSAACTRIGVHQTLGLRFQ